MSIEKGNAARTPVRGVGGNTTRKEATPVRGRRGEVPQAVAAGERLHAFGSQAFLFRQSAPIWFICCFWYGFPLLLLLSLPVANSSHQTRT